MKSKMGARK